MPIAEALQSPPSPDAAASLEVARRWSTPTMVNHSIRCWVFAAILGESTGLGFDRELLYVASMLHDLGVAEHFDAVVVPFEQAGGAVAWTFAAGAGWQVERRDRVRDIIIAHAGAAPNPADDPEGYLLEAATSLDVSGAYVDRWDRQDLKSVAEAIPRLNFPGEFGQSLRHQAARKPTSVIAGFVASGALERGQALWNDLLT